MNTYELMPIGKQKSFYGKAIVNSDGNIAKLTSYKTHVASYDFTTETLTINNWYSATTTKHINAFASRYGYEKITSKNWSDYKPVEKETPIEKDNTFGFMNMFFKMGELTNKNEDDALAYDEKIIFATMRSKIPDWTPPQNWDDLPQAEKTKRLQKIKELI